MKIIKYECTDCDDGEKCEVTIHLKDIRLYDKHNIGPVTCLFALEPSTRTCNWIRI